MPIRRSIAVLSVLFAALAAAPAQAARSATVGPGFGPGIAVDAGGTAYAAWKAVLPDGSGPEIRFCVLARNAPGCSAPPITVPSVEPYNAGVVSVLLPAPGVVDLVLGGFDGFSQFVQRMRSVDGGRSFAAPVRLGNGELDVERATLLPDGRVGAAGGKLRFVAAALRPDGSDASGYRGLETEEVRGELGADVAGVGGDVFAAGSFGDKTSVFRLPAGASGADPASWMALPPLRGGLVRLAGGPSGLVALLNTAPNGPIPRPAVQRLEGSTWGPRVPLGGETSQQDIAQDAAGRLHVVAPRSSALGKLLYARSDDGGALWSERTVLAGPDQEDFDLGLDMGPDGRGASIQSTEAPQNDPIRVRWIEPSRVPQATVRVGNAFVQVRSRCARGREVTVEARASRDGRRVKTSSVLRSARYSSRGGRVRREQRYSARLRLRSAKAAGTVRATLRPRSGGRRVTASFRAVGCRGTQ